MDLLTIENLSKSYGKKQILNDINLTITKGKIIGLLGKNGTGKTTLIKLINGLLIPDAGAIYMNGKVIGVESKKQISYLPCSRYSCLCFNYINWRNCISYYLRTKHI